MGGERETVSTQKVIEKGVSHVVGSIRYHESGGEVHFHDDANHLKVAVPAATWMAAFQKMQANLPSSRQFVDPVRKTVLYVTLRVKPKKPKKEVPRVFAALCIKGGVEIDVEYDALHKFTYGTK